MPLPFASNAYKELAKKYQAMKEEAHAEKERRLQVQPSLPQKLKEREEELAKYSQER